MHNIHTYVAIYIVRYQLIFTAHVFVNVDGAVSNYAAFIAW